MNILNAEVFIDVNGESTWHVDGEDFTFLNTKLSKEVLVCFQSLEKGDDKKFQHAKAGILKAGRYTDDERGVFIVLDDHIKINIPHIQ